jgi:hypothetical protein
MKLGHRLRRKVRAWLERASGRYYEGPTPPDRYAEQAKAFSLQVPSQEAWERFAARLAELAYREGYVRGIEHEVRMPGMVHMMGEREAMLEEERRHGWSLAARAPHLAALLRAREPSDPLASIPDERARLEAFAAQGRLHGTHEVVYLRGDERVPRVEIEK